MYCVIQKVAVKKVPKGEPRGIEVYETRFMLNGTEYCAYKYQNSRECYERPVRESYRISIHESYRENGRVRKKQTVICTIGYYSIVDWGGWPGDFISGGSGLKKKADMLGLTEKELTDLIYTKWQGVVDQVLAEFEQTEEYAAREKRSKIISEHSQRVDAFVKKYGVDRREYDYCYDVFGKLRNPEYLEKIRTNHKARKEYERWSWEQSRGYYDNFSSNYNGCCGTAASRNIETDKAVLKRFYRMLFREFHPDNNPDKDTSEEMKMLNQLKNEWGV